MNRTEFENLLMNISDKLSYYEYEKIYDKTYSLLLANGEKINIKFPHYCIPHLLGININYLDATSCFNVHNAFDLVKQLCDNEYRVYTEMKKGNIFFEQLFSSHVDAKVESFIENTKVNIYNLDFICKYDKSKTFIEGEIGYDFDYILAKKGQNNEIYILGLVKNDKQNFYVPMSNQYFDNIEEATNKIARYLKNQTITFISSLSVPNFKNFYLQPNIKYKKVDRLMQLVEKFDAQVNVSGDYKWMLTKYLDGGSINNEFSNIICEAIKKGEFITPEMFGISDFNMLNYSLTNIILSFNDFLLSNSKNLNISNSSSYSDTISELTEIKKLCETYKTRNEELESDNKTLISKNEQLSNENNEYKETFNKVYKLMNEHHHN